MKLRKLALLLCSLIYIGTFVGCKQDDSGTDISVSSTISEGSETDSKEQNYAQEYQTVTSPEDGWTEESIAKTIRICGKSIDLPFTVGDLGEGFEFVDGTGYVTYNGHDAFVAVFENNDKTDNSYTTIVRKIGSSELPSDEDFKNCFQINGVGIGSDKESVRNALGEPDSAEDGAYEYYIDHNSEQDYLVRFHFGESDVVKSMFVNLIIE